MLDEFETSYEDADRELKRVQDALHAEENRHERAEEILRKETDRLVKALAEAREGCTCGGSGNPAGHYRT